MKGKFIINTTQIDSITAINIDSLTFADIRYHYGTGRSYLIKDNGYEKKYGYKHGVGTNIGDIEESVWMEAVRYIIKREKEKGLFTQLLEWEKEHTHFIHSKKELELHCLEDSHLIMLGIQNTDNGEHGRLDNHNQL